ncbi:MAG: hypothetical protein MN733_41500 [Nitrososphaera sp.]|nr:hypothetical protein [Nitrososphaera sp.]
MCEVNTGAPFLLERLPVADVLLYFFQVIKVRNVPNLALYPWQNSVFKADPSAVLATVSSVVAVCSFSSEYDRLIC